MEITRPNWVWTMDITYMPMASGFVYLAVVLELGDPTKVRSSRRDPHRHARQHRHLRQLDGKVAWRNDVFVERLWRSIKIRGGVAAGLRQRQRRAQFDRALSQYLH